MSMKIHFRMIILVFAALGFASITGCAKSYVIADQPFLVAEAPADLPKMPLRVAIVRTPAMKRVAVGFDEDGEYGSRLAAAMLNGMQTAATLSIRQVDLVEQTPTGGYDIICLPANPYFDVRRSRRNMVEVTLTLEVTIVETATGKQKGMLLEAEGVPGKRPAIPIQIQTRRGVERTQAGVTGALIYSSRLDQAVNNALFYLSLDFGEKLQKRALEMLRRKQEAQ